MSVVSMGFHARTSIDMSLDVNAPVRVLFYIIDTLLSRQAARLQGLHCMHVSLHDTNGGWRFGSRRGRSTGASRRERSTLWRFAHRAAAGSTAPESWERSNGGASAFCFSRRRAGGALHFQHWRFAPGVAGCRSQH